jgi:hypothetical protein
MRTHWLGTALVGAFFGALAFVVLWGGWHLWTDHTQLHLTIDQVAAWQRAAQAAAQPLPSPAP